MQWYWYAVCLCVWSTLRRIAAIQNYFLDIDIYRCLMPLTSSKQDEEISTQALSLLSCLLFNTNTTVQVDLLASLAARGQDPKIFCSVCQSVCLSCESTRLYCAKTAERIKMSCRVNTPVIPWNCVRRGSWSPPQSGVTWPSFELWDPPRILGTAEARDLKFCRPIDGWRP